jgi:hypothetical protein
MLSGEPRLYSRYGDGVIVEAGHFLLRRKHLSRVLKGEIVAMDPRTPVFQGTPGTVVKPGTDTLRSSYLKLARTHGGPIWKRMSNLNPLRPSDMSDGSCGEIANRLYDLNLKAGCQILLSPYFYFQDLEDPWAVLNLDLFEATMDRCDREPVLMVLAFDHRLLAQKAKLMELKDLVAGEAADGYAIWPVGLDETSATPETLYGLAVLTIELNKPCLLLYAGYISMLVAAITGAWFSNGVCFYERRELEVAQPLNFRPSCGYYLRRLRQRVDPVTAVVFYRMLRHLDLEPSFCSACDRNIDGNGFEGIATMPDLDLLEHNLIARRREMEAMSSSSDILTECLVKMNWVLKHKERLSRIRRLGFFETWYRTVRRLLEEPPHNR